MNAPVPPESITRQLPQAIRFTLGLGILVGFARREPEAARALAARRRNRSAGLSAGLKTSR